MNLKRAIEAERNAINGLRTIYRIAREHSLDEGYLRVNRNEIFANLPKGFPKTRMDILGAINGVLCQEMLERDLEDVYSYKGNVYKSVNELPNDEQIDFENKRKMFTRWKITQKVYSK